MNKRTVITIVIAVLMCLVFLGSNPLTVNADGERVQWTTYSGKYMEHPVRVTFIDEESTPTTLLIEKGNTFAEIPSLQDGWKWYINGTETEFTTSTTVSEPLTVKAIKQVNNYDFLGSASGILAVLNQDNGNHTPLAVMNEAQGNYLRACFEDENCEPPVWTFTYDEAKGCVSETECYYTVSSAGGFLNIDTGKISTGGPQSILVKKLGNGTYVLYHVNAQGNKDAALSSKVLNGFIQNGKYNHTKFYISPSINAKYYKNPEWGEAWGLRFYFYNGDGFTGKTYTFNFDVNGGNESRPLSVSTKEDTITMPSYNGVRNGHHFLGWSNDPNAEEGLYNQDVSYSISELLETDSTSKNPVVTLYAVYDQEPILWFDAQGGTVPDPAFYKGSIPYGTLYPVTARDGGYVLEGWEDPASGYCHQPNDPNDPIEMPEEDKTFIARWSPLVRVSFNIGDQDVVVTPQYIDTKAGEEIDLSAVTFDPDLSSKLIGWSDGGHVYSKDSIFIVPEKRDVELTAIWKEDGYTVTFGLNGGEEGTDIPPLTDLTLGQVITLPAYDGKKEGFEFIGWSDSADIMAGNNEDFQKAKFYHHIFKPGDPYLIVKQKDITLYAVWSKNEPEKIKVKFGIRLDGKIPQEPGNYDKNDYTSRFENLNGNYKNFFNVSDKQWVIDVNSLNQWDISPDPDTYYQESDITRFLGAENLPSYETVKKMVASAIGSDKEMDSFDSSKYFVYWYVMKYQGSREDNCSLWHVDGVVVHKRPWVRVVYDLGEISSLVNVTNYPLGYQVDMTEKESQLVTVGAESADENAMTKTPIANGYEFVGWTVKDSGDDIILNGEQYSLPKDKDVTFVAQWRSKTLASQNLTGSQVIVKWAPKEETIIPSAVKVKLVQRFEDGSTNDVGTYTLTAADQWSKFVSSLPAKDKNGASIVYEWVETAMKIGETFFTVVPENKTMYTVKTVSTNTGTSSRTEITNTLARRSITITAGSDSRVYNGKPLTKNTWTSTALAAGDSIESVIVTGSQTVAGTSENVPSAAKIVNAAGEDVTASYGITYTNGTLEVTKRALTITAGSDSKAYDGTALTKDSYTNTDLAAGDRIESVAYSGSQTVVGFSDNAPSAAKIVNAAGDDVTGSYEITYNNGKLEVTKIAVTITAGSDKKVYDGTPLTKDSFTHTALAEGDRITSVTCSGSQTVVGTSVNTPSAAVIKNAAGEDVTASYEINYTDGTLEVLKKAVMITADDDTKVYDGTPLTKNSYTNTTLAAGDRVDSVTVSGSRTVVGSSDNVPSGAKIVNTDGADVTACYEINYANGTLEVTKKSIFITAGSDKKVYDGKELTNDGWISSALAAVSWDEVSETTSDEMTDDGETRDNIDGLAAGDAIESVTVTGSQTVVGSSDNVPSAAVIKNAAGEDVTASYEITYANGKLEVTLKSLTITADSDTKAYDGTALTKGSCTNTGLVDGDSIDSVTVTGSQTVVGKSNNVPSDAKIVNAAGEDVTASYDITYTDGELEVTQKAVTITADSDTKVYDGIALTKNSYTNTALAEGESIESVTVAGSQTVTGKGDNVPSSAKIVNAAGEDVTASYEVTYKNGTLEVTKKPVTVIADSVINTYDGTALTKDSYTNTALAEGDGIVSVTVTGSQSVVGKSNNVPSAAKIVNAAGDDVTASYEITYANGTLEVTKKALTVTADSDSKVYDGTALTKNSYTNTDLAAGDRIDSVTVTGSQTVVGKSNNIPSAAKILNAEKEDVTGSYKITYTNGTLEVTKKALTVTADSDSKVYDGTALTKDSYTATALAEGDKIESVTVAGSQTVAGSSDNVPSAVKVVNAEGKDVTASYDITCTKGTLEVTKKALTVTADGDSKIYDGTALTKDSYTNTDLAAGDSIDSVTVTGSQTVAGSSDNVPSAAKIVNSDGTDVTASYEITYTKGTLEVTKKALTVTADSDTKVYDGTALTKNSYTNTDLAAGDKIDSATVTGSQTVVGSSDNVPSAAKIVNAAGTEVTASYEITYSNGTLEVTKKTLTITADSDTKVYDGTALTKDSYINTALAEGDSVESVTVTGTQTVVGSSDNVPSAAVIKNAAGEDVTASYEITYTNGTMEVTKKALTVTADSETKVYDSIALTKDSYTNTTLAEGDVIDSVTVTGSQTVVGTSDNVPSSAVIKNAAGEDVTESYEISYQNGTLQITRNKALIITADSDTKVYDGTALTKNSYQVAGLAAGDSIESVTVAGSQTVVGSSDNVPSAAVIKNSAGDDVTASYEITYINGKLEVTKKTVTITADSDKKVYDGTALTKDSYTNTDLAAGDRIDSVIVTGSQTVVGSSDNVPSAAKIVNTAGEDVTASYEITCINGTLEVTKKALTVTADSDEKVYDGTALTKDSYTNTDLAAGDKFESVTVTGSQTVVGTSDNVPSAAKIVNTDGEDITASYIITYANGTLEVTQKELTITADGDTKIYDGTALTKKSFTNTDLASGDSVDSVTTTGSQTVSGTSYNVPSAAKIVNAANEDVTASYKITYGNGTLEVTKKEVTITADGDTKVYDGTALAKKSFTNTALGEGDKVDSVTMTGSQTVVGTSDNVPSAAVIKNTAGENVTSSYDISYVNGTLEVTKKAVTITADSGTKVYDGIALSKDSYTNTALAAGDSIETVTVTGSQTVAGTSDNVPSAAKIVNAAGDDVTASYEITYTNGTLEVTQKAVTITADSDTKVYDGTALTKDSYTNTVLAEGDTIESVTVTGSQTVVGESGNVPSAAKIVNAENEDVTASYDITYANGSLEVTKMAVTITADSDTKVYDGTALLKDSYTNTALAGGDSIDSVTVTGTQTVAGSSDNVPSAAKIVNAEGEDVTGSYEITYANGTLEVTPKAITITADTDTKVYDGTALTKNSYNNTALAAGDSIDSVTVTGTQTVVGESDNVPSAAKIVNAEGEDVTASYEITYANGTLEVTKKAVTITADSDTKVYDAAALTKNSYINTDPASGDVIDSVTVTGSQTVVGSSDNVPSAAKIVNVAGEDVTVNYDITYVNGTLEVTKKAVTITAGSDTKVYDGTVLTKNSYTSTDLAAGDKIDSVTVIGYQAVVGESDNVPSAAKIVNAEGEDVTDSYEITYANGSLVVTVNKSAVITADSDTKVYDGTALTKDSYQAAGLAAGDSIETVVVTGSQIVAGISDNVPSAAKIVNAAGTDVTGSYEITYAKGTLEVTQKALTITADSDTKVYDGTALTKDSYTNTALAADDSIDSVIVTGSQSLFGNSDNVPSAAKIVNAAGEDVTASYEITYAKGTLEVTKKALTITADSDTKVYDGTALTKDSYANTALAESDSIETVVVTGSQTVVGTGTNVPSAAKIVNAAGEDVAASYEITYKTGTLVVTKKAVTITADSDTKIYDGTALAKESYTTTDLAAGDSIESVTVTGSQSIVGTSANVPSAAKIVNAAGEDVTASYEVTYANGTLEVTKKVLTITADSSDPKVYDGTALTMNSYTNTDLGIGDKIESVTVTGSQTVAGTSANVPSDAKIVNANGEDVTASYQIIYANGTLEVTQKPLTVTADSDWKVYDGIELTKDSYNSSVHSSMSKSASRKASANVGSDHTLDHTLAVNDSFANVTVTGSQTVVGFSDNVPSAAKIVNAAGEDVTASYKITYVNGTLEVTHKILAITADSGSKTYDGTALIKNSYINTALAGGDKIESVTVTGSQTVVGSIENVPSAAVIKNAAGENVTANYDITYINGMLEVTPKAVTITADSGSKTYDGTALMKNSYTNTDLAAGDKISSVTVTGSQTVAGSSDNVPSAAKIVNAAGEDVTGSYAITYKSGTLNVTTKALTISADSDTKVYDGTALTKDSYKKNTDLGTGDSIESVTVTGSQTVAGESDNVPSAAKIVNAQGTDVTASYRITYVNGTLKVTAKAVTVTADSDTKVYDGTALTKNSYTNTALAGGDSVDSVTVTGSQTVVGKSDNVPSGVKILNAAGEDVTASYGITYAKGTLEVTKKAVTITAGDATKVYDGTALMANTYVSTALAEGDTITALTVTGTQTVAGESDNVPSNAVIRNASNEDVTGSYEITYRNGTLQITLNKALIITAGSDTKVYDGKPLVKNTYHVAGLAAGDSVESVKVTGSQTVVGTGTNVPSAAVIKNAAGDDVTASYGITYKNGTLKVTQKALTITADSDTRVYDGTPLEKKSYTSTVLADGDSIDSVTVDGSQTVVGSSVNVPSAAKILNAAREDVTASYYITYTNGTLEVTKMAVTITADSDTKVYDDTALTNKSYTSTALAAGDSIDSVTVTGSQTVVGSSANVPSAAKIVNTAREDVTASYEITYANGTLEVTKKAVTITADSGTKIYDGTALIKDSYTSTALATGDKIESVTVTGSQTLVGSSDNVPTAAKIVNAAGEDVTDSYDVSYANGTLEVTKKAVTVTADTDTKVYDGTALTKDGYTTTDLAKGDSIDSVTVTGSQTIAGSSENVPSAAKIVNADGEDVTTSYNITYANGTLMVLQKDVTVTAESETKVYDSTALTNNGYTTTDLAEGDSVDSVTVTGSQTLAGSSVNVPSAAKIVNTDGEDVTTSYNITYVNGALEVTQKTIIIVAGSDTKVYDGTALMEDSYTSIAVSPIPMRKAARSVPTEGGSDPSPVEDGSAPALAEGDIIESVTVTGMQTFFGSSENVADNAVIRNADGEDVTASYNIIYVEGTLEVTKRAVTITAGSETSEYNGETHTNVDYTNTPLAEGDTIDSIIVTGSQTVTGISENVLSGLVIKNKDGVDVTANYTITFESGTLEVTRKPVTITAGSATKVYDGKALTENSFTHTVLVEGDKIESVTVTGSLTEAGETKNVPSAAVIKNKDGDDVTLNYRVIYKEGTLKVTQKPLTITADSDTKVYDGTALTDYGYTSTALVDGDRFGSVTVTGSQTGVGTVENVPSAAKIVNGTGENVKDVTESYNITYVKGTLEVTKKELLIRADSETKVYDGKSLSRDGYTTSELAAGDRIDSITVEGSRIYAGLSPNEVKDAVILNEAGERVNDNYKISYISGTLTVAAAPVTVAADSFTKEYGQLDMPFTARVTGILEGEDSSLITYELSREEGENPGEYVITPSGAEVQGNYSVSYLPGKLTVTWNPTTFSAEKVWIDDNNRDGIRPISLGVVLTGSNGSIHTRRLSEANGWKVSVEDLPLYYGGQPITYTWSEEEVPGYTGQKEVLGNVTVFTNTHVIARTTASVTLIWDDRDNAGRTRPDFLGVILFSNGVRLFSQTLNNENGWMLTVDNLPMYEKGTPINYVWNQQSAGNGYYAVSSTASAGNTTLVNSNLYTMKIRYTYADGSQAAADYVDRLAFGETFVVDSPARAGYRAGQPTVVGMMPSHDVVFTVIYTREGEETQRTAVVESKKSSDSTHEGSAQKDVPHVPEQMVVDIDHPVVLSVPTRHIDIDDYGTALGLGDVYMTTGGTFSFE